jgi:hypothetical protein
VNWWSRFADADSLAEGHRRYDPQKWRELAYPMPTLPELPSHWRGAVPDPSVYQHDRVGPGDVSLPEALLAGKLGDLRVLLWARLRSWFYEDDGEATYEELAGALLGRPVTPAKMAKVGTLLRPMLGTWIHRRQVGRRRFLYQTGGPFRTTHAWGFLRAELFASLTEASASGPQVIRPADLVNFARWKMLCADLGWTIENPERIAKKWRTPAAAVEASPDRLTRLGWLLTFPRSESQGGGHLVWFAEQYDSERVMVEITDAHRRRSLLTGTARSFRTPSGDIASDSGEQLDPDLTHLCDYLRDHSEQEVVTLGFDDLRLVDCVPRYEDSSSLSVWEGLIRSPRWVLAAKGRTTLVDLERREVTCVALHKPLGPAVGELRLRRQRRRQRAYADLLAPRRTLTVPAQRWGAHEVYLLHFPAEQRFKVGLARCASGRVAHFLRHGGVLVDRITLADGFLAEIVEADVLSLTEEWHRLGDPYRSGGGYTEMWTDSGPTVDSNAVAEQAMGRLRDLRSLLDGSGTS